MSLLRVRKSEEDVGRRILLLGCSQRKREDGGLLPAVERYDGPAFRLFRRFLRGATDSQTGTAVPTLSVLSAEFGLITGEKAIPWYERKLTRRRAQELGPDVQDTLARLVAESGAAELYVGLGRAYLEVLDGFRVLCSPGLQVTVASGSSGRRLAGLHDWLYGAPPVTRDLEPGIARGTLTLRGVAVAADAAATLESARAGLKQDPVGAARYQGWYVLVDGQRVAPKWLVSRLTSLPPRRFHSDDARRLLARLGLEVSRA